MQKVQRKYFAIAVVIISIVTLSLKDTFNITHAFLHSIPNPFHSHSLSHSFFHSHDHAHGHSHDLSDHIAAIEEEPEKQPLKNKTEKDTKTLKVNLFSDEIICISFNQSFSLLLVCYFHSDSFLPDFFDLPTNPPPEPSCS